MILRMKKAFHITTRSLATPLSFDEVSEKYGASAKDVRAVKMFVFGDSGVELSSPVSRNRTRTSSGKPRSRSTRVAGARKK